MSSSGEREEEKETGRLEALSDGIFAVAVTLLVLEVKIPPPQTPGLANLVWQQWPAFLAYVISFVTILIMWVNHHAIFKLVHRTDHTFQIINGLLMLVITFVNYPTAVLAEHMQTADAGDRIFAAAFYSATFILISIMFQVLWHYATGKRRLVRKSVDPALIATITSQYRFGPLLYVVAFALAFVSVWASVAVNGGLAIYFAFTGQMTRYSGKTRPLQAELAPEGDQSSADAAG